ncbi:MAG: dihydrodipicolinate synthase family protein [Desulfohalobiaceae bacterium]|nr:dihydrodipicolinate synthase family protein [Desulfohalobiaceae bacterium]
MELTGVIPPVPTPFDRGEPAFGKLAENIARWNRTGLSGFLILGSNGEPVYLNEQEKLAVVEKARECIPDSKAMLVGTGLESTRETVRFTNLVADLGADYALVAPPFYYKGSMQPKILFDHFRAVADDSRIPILLYNVPQFTGVNLEPTLVAGLAEHPNIVGIKDSQGNIGQLNETIYSTDPEFLVFVGSAPVFYPALCIGARGGILAVANVIPELCCDIFNLFTKNSHEKARRLQNRITPLAKAVTVKYGIAGLKAVMDTAGYFGGQPRLPLQGPDPEVQQELDRLLRKL